MSSVQIIGALQGHACMHLSKARHTAGLTTSSRVPTGELLQQTPQSVNLIPEHGLCF